MQRVVGSGLIATSSRTATPAPLVRPSSCAAALAALAAHADPVFVAGGTDLCAQFNQGLQPGALIALDRIAALSVIAGDAQELRIGSGVTHAVGCAHPLVQARLPGFAEAWRLIANVRIRFWATIGGNVMARRTRYEMSLLLTALDARLSFLDSGGTIHRATPADVWAGRFPTPGLLHHVAIPLRGRTRLVYDRSLRPVATLALRLDDAGAAAVIATEHQRPYVLDVAAGAPPADAAAAAFANLPDDFADAATSNWYLRRAGTVMLRRALQADRDQTELRSGVHV